MKFDRQELRIEGGRKLYLYRFEDEVEAHSKQDRIWSSVAEGWRSEAEFVEDWFADATKLLLEPFGDEGGMILDLACGAQSMRMPGAWRRIGVDVSQPMLLGRPGTVRASTGDLPFRSESFASVVCRLGLMFAADVERAFAEVARVMKPGGTLSFMVWGPAERNRWSSAVTEVLSTELGLEEPGKSEPSAFRLADVKEVETLLHQSGFGAAEMREVVVDTWARMTPEAAVSELDRLAGPTHLLLRRFAAEERARIDAKLAQVLAEADRTGVLHVWRAIRGPSAA